MNLKSCVSYSSTGAQLFQARVNALDGERFGVVCSDGQRHWLKTAFGCLVRPVVGDVVLICRDETNGYILNILERGSVQEVELRMPGDLKLVLPKGQFSITTREGMLIDAGDSLVMQANQGVACFGDALFTAQHLQVTGKYLESRWHERSEYAIRHTHVAMSYRSDIQESQRRICGHENVRAGSQRQLIEKECCVHANVLDMQADVLVTVDAQRINLG